VVVVVQTGARRGGNRHEDGNLGAGPTELEGAEGDGGESFRGVLCRPHTPCAD
jgi:hypothetical protein